MTAFAIAGRRIDLSAVPVTPRALSGDDSAWQGGDYVTVRLLAPAEALRVHTNGRAFPDREASASAGAWVAIGDVIQTSAQFANSRSLPTWHVNSTTAFTHVNTATIPAGCVVNIGIASAKFGGQGGGFQAEYVSGPLFQFTPLTGKHWHGRAGSA